MLAPAKMLFHRLVKLKLYISASESVFTQCGRMWQTVLIAAALLAAASSQSCISRRSVATGEDDGHYCVCNSTYCDDAPPLLKPRLSSVYSIVTSSKSSLRFHVSRGIYGNVVPDVKPAASITLDPSKRYQKIVGFGGAVTDSVGYNIRTLSSRVGTRLIMSYFGPGGLDYSMIRTPMGGTDFSNRSYSYAMTVNDTSLRDFRLQAEDHLYKIPIIRRAMQMSKYYIKLITAPWSASPWMKTNNDWTNSGKLLKEYWQLWADYFVKYFQAYRMQGFEFWGLSPQNEPEINTYLDTDINGMSWTAEEQRDWVVDHLAPTLKNAGFYNLKIFVGDDNRQSLPNWPRTVMSDPKARSVVHGTAVHWYFDRTYSPSALDVTKELFPDKLILYTEACTGVQQAQRVILGSWQRGEAYARDIIENMNHWVSSWIDWNMALNEEGGPTYVRNFVDSPIIVNATADEFYKQPMYYAMGHFSKYVTPGSIRIGSTVSELSGVDHVAFFTPERATVLVLLNTDDESKDFLLDDPRKGQTKVTLPPKSISTLKYW